LIAKIKGREKKQERVQFPAKTVATVTKIIVDIISANNSCRPVRIVPDRYFSSNDALTSKIVGVRKSSGKTNNEEEEKTSQSCW